VKISAYILGRISVVAAVTFVLQWLFSIGAIAVYVFRWGGVYNLLGMAFLADSAYRLLLIDLCPVLPITLVFAAGTYLLGSLMRSGFAASITMLTLLVANYAFTMLYQYRDFVTYFDYFCPDPRMLFRYVTYYGTSDTTLQRIGATLESAIFCA